MICSDYAITRVTSRGGGQSHHHDRFFMENPEDLNAILGVDASIDLMTTDPVAKKGTSDYDLLYEKGNQLTVLAYSLQILPQARRAIPQKMPSPPSPRSWKKAMKLIPRR